MDKVMEEWGELKNAIACGSETGDSKQMVQMEFGDLLFTLVNVARFLGINPESALTESTQKFEGRFRHMEKVIKESRREMTRVSQEEKDDLWECVKGQNGAF
jgi:uncharacterized protein YabN with tetrapyrrole methylase and pyrophosphatase domain